MYIVITGPYLGKKYFGRREGVVIIHAGIIREPGTKGTDRLQISRKYTSCNVHYYMKIMIRPYVTVFIGVIGNCIADSWGTVALDHKLQV